MQGVGLNRVDLGAAPTRDIGGGKPEQQTAEAGGDEGVERIERNAARQPLARIEANRPLKLDAPLNPAWVAAHQPGRPVQEFLTYQITPEPGAWLLMAAVFAGLGLEGDFWDPRADSFG